MITPLRLNRPVHTPARASETREPARTGQTFGLAGAATGSASAGQNRPSSPVTSLATLVAIQALEERTSARKRATRRGEQILDELDSLKLAILEGRVGQEALEQIARRIETERDLTGDEGLDDLLAAIELRARVELAKHESRSGRSG